jgi:hypothetical protein
VPKFTENTNKEDFYIFKEEEGIFEEMESFS